MILSGENMALNIFVFSRFLFHKLPVEYNSGQSGDHLCYGEGQPEAVQADP